MKVGGKVRLQQDHRNWEGAIIVEKTLQPRPFIVQRADEKKLPCNTSHIRPTEATIQEKTEANVIPEHTIENSAPASPVMIRSNSVMKPTIHQQVSEPHTNYLTTTAITTADDTPPKSRSGRTIKPPTRYGEWVK